MPTEIAAAFKQDWAPVTDRDKRVLLAQLDLAARAIQPVAWVIPPSTFVIASVYTIWGSFFDAVPWIVLTCLGCLAVGIAAHAFLRRNRAGQISDPQSWVFAIGGAGLFFAAMWGSMAAWLWVPGDDLNHMYLTLILACSLAAACVLNGANLVSATPQVVIYWLSMIVPGALEGGLINFSTATLSTAFFILMLGAAVGIRMTTYKMLMLREERSDFIERLAEERDQAERAKIRAETASRAKSQFLANMSHELRTPLNAILGFSEVMKTQVFGPLGKPIYCEYSGHIHSSGTHLLGLINDILDLSRIEAGRMTLSLGAIRIGEMAEDALLMIKQRAEAAGQLVRLEIEPGLPAWHVDQRALRQVLLNLLSNAVKFTPKGGTIAVFARREADGGLSFGVADTGAGIALKDQKKVFEPFGQGQHDIAVCEKGTGLGLPIVKGLIEAHGGSVALDSAPGKGTTVTVYLPPATAVAPEVVQAPLQAAG